MIQEIENYYRKTAHPLPIAMAVFPVPGCPAISTARPAILLSCHQQQNKLVKKIQQPLP